MDASCENEDGEKMRLSLIFHGSCTLWIFICAGRNECEARFVWPLMIIFLSTFITIILTITATQIIIIIFCISFPCYLFIFFKHFLWIEKHLKKKSWALCAQSAAFLTFICLSAVKCKFPLCGMIKVLSIYLSTSKHEDGSQIEYGGSLLGRHNAVLSDQIG